MLVVQQPSVVWHTFHFLVEGTHCNGHFHVLWIRHHINKLVVILGHFSIFIFSSIRKVLVKMQMPQLASLATDIRFTEAEWHVYSNLIQEVKTGPKPNFARFSRWFHSGLLNAVSAFMEIRNSESYHFVEYKMLNNREISASLLYIVLEIRDTLTLTWDYRLILVQLGVQAGKRWLEVSS